MKLPQYRLLKISQKDPTTLEAEWVDIVTCKECKHNPWDFDRTDFTCVWDDDFADRPQTPDDFCSYGEREDE